MPLELQIIRASEFIQLGAQGQFDLKVSKQALATLAAACRKRGINLALLDLRAVRVGATPVFSREDLTELVSVFPQVGFGQHQYLAILYRSDPHQRVRLFSFLSSMHGWNVKAFTDFERAMLWLSSRPEQVHFSARVISGARLPVRGGAHDPVPVRKIPGFKRSQAASA